MKDNASCLVPVLTFEYFLKILLLFMTFLFYNFSNMIDFLFILDIQNKKHQKGNNNKSKKKTEARTLKGHNKQKTKAHQPTRNKHLLSAIKQKEEKHNQKEENT